MNEKDKPYLIPEISLPVSKSIGARFLVASFFAKTLPADPYFDDNDDLMVLQQALLAIYSDEEPIDYGDTPIDLHASGTAMRFVTAVCASTEGADFVITGTPRLCARPMDPLIDVLREAGAEISPLGLKGEGPYRVSGKKLKGGEFSIRGDISSQFISALMLSAPSWEKGMKLNFSTPLVSIPYIEMTASLMKEFGIKVTLTDRYVEVGHGDYVEPVGFKVEADWSSSSFFYEACAIGGKEILLEDLVAPEKSMQGDAECCRIFEKLGVSTEFAEKGAVVGRDSDPLEDLDLDFSNCPDLVLPYAVASLLSGSKFRFSGVANLRLKESDRIEALIKESEKLGYKVTSGDDFILWDGTRCEPEEDPVIETYDDHRVAMSFAMAALKLGKIRIANPDVVEKSFAMFWGELAKIDLDIRREEETMIVTYNQ